MLSGLRYVLSCSLLSLAWANPAFGQAIGDGRPLPTIQSLDRMGVDLRSGRRSSMDGAISIGGGSAPALTYSFGAEHRAGVPLWGYVNLGCIQSGNYACSQPFRVFDRSDGMQFETRFQSLVLSDGAQIETFIGGLRVYEKDGSISTYTSISGGTMTDRQAYLTSIRRPDGEVINYHYPSVPSGSGIHPVIEPAIRSITTSSGYQLHLERSGSSKRVTLINRAYFRCDPLAVSCSDSSHVWPSAVDSRGVGNGTSLPGAGSITFSDGRSISYSQAQQGAAVGTDNSGRTIYAYSQNVTDGAGVWTSYTGRWNNGYYAPQDWGGFGCAGFFTLTQVATAAEAWNYNYIFTSGCPGGSTTVTAPGGGTTNWREGGENGDYTEHLTDELGRVTRYTFSGPTWPTAPYTFHKRHVASITRPEGDRAVFAYDARYNLTSVTQAPKPGSAEPTLTWSSTYPTSCTLATAMVCNRPTSTTDARGSTADYTYSADHGGVLTETGPAVNGVRPQTRHEYAQRYAWISDGAGGHVSAESPIWVRTATSMCRASAATGNPAAPCAIAGDEIRTTFDYGPNSGPNNLQVRGQVVSSAEASLRTCFGYDKQGNRISETGPNASLSSCP